MKRECIIRADGNAKIGAGHLMRCLTIAEAMRTMQTEEDRLLFVCAEEQSAALVREHGFEVEVLDTDYLNMEAELPKLEKLLSIGETRRILLVDSYYVTAAYLQALGRLGRTVLLDDMQKCVFPVDAVINYNAFADRAVYEKLYEGTNTKLYIGSSYVPIREQFLQKKYQVADTVRNVLITTGGSDKDNLAGQILQELFQMPDSSKLNYHLITGRFNPHMQELKRLEALEPGLHIHYDVKDMAALMADCDLAITAGGTTIYELSVIGVPFICFSYAENQEALTEYIGRRQIAGFAGACHRETLATIGRIRQLFMEYSTQMEKRNMCYEKERALIDGFGANRLAQLIWEEA